MVIKKPKDKDFGGELASFKLASDKNSISNGFQSNSRFCLLSHKRLHLKLHHAKYV